ncbi:MAG TPA: hypothetical protein VHA52_02460 [Candidatus Babeliaceae bacterium]|nr:hypothetical protein [Candidatus Babeliaceae bacterium]
MLILGEPGDQSYLNPIISDLGVQLSEGTLVDTSQHLQPNLMALKPSQNAVNFSDYFDDMSQRKEALYMPTAGALILSPSSTFNHQILFQSGSKSWLETANSDQLKTNTNKPSNVPKAGSYPTVITLTKQVKSKQQRIIVTSDADFLSNGELLQIHMQTPSGNYEFMPVFFSWLSYGIAPIDEHRPNGIDNGVTINDKSWSRYSILLKWVYPCILILIAFIIYVRRKSR